MTLDNWGITITAEDPSPTGVTLCYQIPKHVDGEITIPLNQTLLKADGDNWVEVNPYIFHDRADWAKWLSADPDETRQRLDWSKIYGALEPGQYSIRKTIWLNQDGLGYQKDFYVDFSIPFVDRVGEGIYIPTECLYMNPLSSYFPEEGNVLFTVEIHSGCNILSPSGEPLDENPNVTWGWRKLNESGEDVAFFLRWLEFDGKLELSEDTLYQKLAENYHLLLEDGELILVQGQERQHENESVWSIHRLEPLDSSPSVNITTAQGFSMTILGAGHYSNGISLDLHVTFPAGTELNDKDAPYPQNVRLTYPTKSGTGTAEVYNLQSRALDAEAGTITYHMQFVPSPEAPTGTKFNLSVSGFSNTQGNTVFSAPLSLTWYATVKDAEVYEYKVDGTHIRMTISPLAINITANHSKLQTIDEIYDNLMLLDNLGNPIPHTGFYGGSQGNSLVVMDILPDNPIDVSSIDSIVLGPYTIKDPSWNRIRVPSKRNITTPEEIIADLVENQPPITMFLHQNGQNYQTLGAWNSTNHVQFSSSLGDFTFEEITEAETHKSENFTSFQYSNISASFGITFYEGSSDIQVISGSDIRYYRAAYPYDDTMLISDLMRNWFDEAEYCDLLNQFLTQTPHIPNNGQDYHTAAQEFCQRYEDVKLKTNPGSAYRYSFVKCEVAEETEATSLARTRGELDENGYAFSLYVYFVPENDRAWKASMPGNTGEYDGNDPDIPEGAWVYIRCGYITATEYGWQGEIVGTCW